METPTADRPALDEKVWQEWVQKTKLREQATARKLMTLARMGLALLALGTALYVLIAR